MLLGAGCSSDSPGPADAATPAPGAATAEWTAYGGDAAAALASRRWPRSRATTSPRSPWRGRSAPARRRRRRRRRRHDRLRGHADRRRRHALSLHAARQGLRPRSRDRHRALAVRRAGRSPRRTSATSPAAASPRGSIRGAARGRAVPPPHLPRDDRRAPDRARRRGPAGRAPASASRGTVDLRTGLAQPAAVRRRVRDDLAAGRRQRRGRDRLGDRRQQPDRRGQRRGARLRRAHRRAALDLGSDPARGQPIRRGRPGTGRMAHAHRRRQRVGADRRRSRARPRVRVPTSSPSPDYYGGERLGDNRYANSIVALRASTGAASSGTSRSCTTISGTTTSRRSPALVTVRRDGREVPGRRAGDQDRPALRAAPGDGRADLPGARSGRCPRAPSPGRRLSPTQPFSVAAAASARSTSRPTTPGGSRRWDRAALPRSASAALRNEGVFTPPEPRGHAGHALEHRRGALGWRGLRSRRARSSSCP